MLSELSDQAKTGDSTPVEVIGADGEDLDIYEVSLWPVYDGHNRLMGHRIVIQTVEP